MIVAPHETSGECLLDGSQETSSIQAGHSGTERDSALSGKIHRPESLMNMLLTLCKEINRAADPKVAISTVGPRYCTRLQDRLAIPNIGARSIAGGSRGSLNSPFRRHQPLRHPFQTSDHPTERHKIGKTSSRRSEVMICMHKLYVIPSGPWRDKVFTLRS